MKKQDICPTCGTSLGPLHDKKAMRRCDGCNRVNPRGFYYCGYCAAPMESTSHAAAVSKMAAPEGGWPSLAQELLEVRFFIDRGELDEAFELLAILRERHPGHPELIEFKRGAVGPAPDTQVNRVVDSVLSGSSDLSATITRRQVPEWKAPQTTPEVDDGHTRAHELLPSDERPSRRKRVIVSEDKKAKSFPALTTTAAHEGPPPSIEADQEPDEEPTRVRMRTDRHVGLPGPQPDREPKARRTPRITMLDGSLSGAGPVTVEGPPDRPTVDLDALEAESVEPEASAMPVTAEPGVPQPIDESPVVEDAPAPEVTQVSPAPTAPAADEPSVESEPTTDQAAAVLEAGRAAQQAAEAPGRTVAVPTLQPPAPYADPDPSDDEVTTERKKKRRVRGGAIRKRSLKGRKHSGRQQAIKAPDPERPRRRRGRQFGSHVLGRLGGKD